MNYADARSLIADGDLIAVRGTEGFLTPFTKFFTRSDYTHAGIAVWMDGGLWMAELNSGKNHLIPLSQLESTAFDVYACPVENPKPAIMNMLRIPLPYSLAALFVIGLLNWLRIKIFLHWRQLLVCSGYCVKIYEAAGWGDHSRLVSPQELAASLTLKIEVRPA